MKIAIFILLVFLFSCEKAEKETCWTCITLTWMNGYADHKTVYDEFNTCDEGVMLLWQEKWKITGNKLYHTTCK